MSNRKKIEEARDDLLERARTLLVTVTGDDGVPDMSTSPYLRDEDGAIYIYSSALSAHLRALIAGNQARFMIIADESQSQNIWARLRLKFLADSKVIDRDSPAFIAIADRMESHFGPTMGLIRQFVDFHMVKITPKTGVIVTGFASAYHVSGADFTVGEQIKQT